MLVVRPIRETDFPALLGIAEASGVGFTSLPVNEDLLKDKIKASQQAFAAQLTGPKGEGYLMVLEETDTGEVIGTCGIHSAVGMHDTFYNYHVGQVVHSSRQLNIHNRVELLSLTSDYTGAAELCTLFLYPDKRGKHAGRLLSKCRFLLMAEHPHRFGAPVIAEMRGYSDQDGRSPFWNWLDEHFFSMDFPTADYLTGIGNKVFIAELMPKYPIYVKLLSDEAQAVIGKVHPQTAPALKLLEQEGFGCRGYVDIFDAGPTVECQLRHIRTVRHSRHVAAHIGEVQGNAPLGLIANTSVEAFRCTLAPLSYTSDGSVVIDEKTAQVLMVTESSPLRVCALDVK